MRVIGSHAISTRPFVLSTLCFVVVAMALPPLAPCSR